MKIQRRTVNSSTDQVLDSDPVIDRIYKGRNAQSKDEFDYALAQLLPYHLLKGIDACCSWLYDAFKAQDRICIIGDYDVDGATSTTVMLKGLAGLGFTDVCYMIPNRIKDGYGLTPALVDRAISMQAQRIITVDNGIVSYQGVDYANANGVSVLITDHHMAAEKLPEAVVVNPNQLDCTFPSKTLAGVGVAYYVLIAFRAYLRDQGHDLRFNLLELIDIVALGTVADCVPLDKNNRLLVHHGLKRMRSGQVSHGIAALLSIAKRNPKLLASDDLGFAVAPRLNAAGRLDDMSIGVQCLMSDSAQEAHSYAQTLDSINLTRREIQANMLDEAQKSLETVDVKNEKIAIVYGEKWHEGIIGLVASMLKETHNIPAIAMANDSDNTILKGSCRSIPGLNIRDVLVDFDLQHPGVLIKFGGHAMAAGLSLNASRLTDFTEGMRALIQEKVTDDMLQKCILVDGPLPQSHRNLPFARLLLTKGPWGQCFEKPVFDDVFTLESVRKVGQAHLKLSVRDSEQQYDAIWFFCPESWFAVRAKQVRLIYALSINDFNGKRSVQLMVQHAQVVESLPIVS
ncbi:single-stranded-DNA-specific exonuclease RecJ [Candidatus Comchoanobacter bicostacola]|uniref:Single-stranded-DNA-specific exonuclease RecJ n=1 Tax=Candidatus Comchoanobacter bicostacola TaxID=2919598 RepID=A0ABY5DJQ9_9GAMM|nr:single-stranded-DNA-specific exonuclease RecJ [Candidatus Comchoanobacter bicostacola]UTC24159.1 single-stranded-DNA-specific exonuclease RecJ [Candidatus Comchoanobacter bicostacola]